LVFIGTVVRVNATTVPEVSASESTAIVRVDEVVEGPDAPPDLAGKEITVQLSRPGGVKPGEHATFFTKGWLLGDSMAVIEVGHSAETLSPQQVRDTVHGERQKAVDQALQEEIVSAELIVTGKVTRVAPAGIPELPTEHTPLWKKADIEVESALKGHVTGHSVYVLFPASEDPAWHTSPKFREGQQGIWLLHRNQLKLRGVENQYTVLKPLDFQTRDELGRVQRLAKDSR
jgi:hypothetical protein